jgi:hypothetical protein
MNQGADYFARLNNLHANSQFVAGHAAVAHFEELVREVRGLARPSERLAIPDRNGAGSWNRLYALFLALKTRRIEEPHVNHEVIAQASKAALHRTLWNNYCEARQKLYETSKLESSWRLMAEYTELQPNDLDTPSEGASNWRQVASRVSHALKTIEALSAAERESIPAVLRQRRADASAILTAQRIAELEKALSIKHAKELVENHGQ